MMDDFKVFMVQYLANIGVKLKKIQKKDFR